MSMTGSSFYTLNHGLGFMSKHRNQSLVRRNYSVHAVPPSSCIPKQEESGKNPTDSNKNSQSNTANHLDDLSGGGSLLTHSNSIGIIGGVSTNNNLRFVNKLVKWSSSMNEEEDSTPFVLCSDPSLSRMLSSSHHHSTVVANLRRKRSFLENAGARCIVMPCHNVPFLHIGD